MAEFLIILFIGILPPVVVLWYIVWVCIHIFYWSKPRWMVWYPPTMIHGTRHEAMWSGPASKPMAQNYAKIFGGKVYRIK